MKQASVSSTKGGRKPINATCETVRNLPTFRVAYRRRRCIVPVDGFFERKEAIKRQKAKQPYAIAMKDGSPFGLGGLWENWKGPTSGEWTRTFAIITTAANELVADLHDCMPLILAPADYVRWLGDEPDPHDLMRPFPAEPMRMRPISTRGQQAGNRRSLHRRAGRVIGRLGHHRGSWRLWDTGPRRGSPRQPLVRRLDQLLPLHRTPPTRREQFIHRTNRVSSIIMPLTVVIPAMPVEVIVDPA